MRLNHDHFDAHRRAQQVDHLLVGERGDHHLADLHQSAALPQPRLPSEAEGLDVRHDPLEVDVEAELAEAVAAQRHLRCLATSGGDLKTGNGSIMLPSDHVSAQKNDVWSKIQKDI